MQITLQGHPAYAYTGGRPFNPARPCVVFIHGALNDHSVWTLAARWLAHHGASVLAIDQPGHMRSRGPLLPDVEAIADWVWHWLDAVGVHQAALVGHSMGSLIALEAAARQPERASRLVMVGTAYPMKVSPALLQAAAQDPAAGMTVARGQVVRVTVSKGVQRIVVPNTIGKSAQNARDELTRAGLRVDAVEENTPLTVAGVVFEQQPRGGEVDPAEPVVIKVSRGPARPMGRG